MKCAWREICASTTAASAAARSLPQLRCLAGLGYDRLDCLRVQAGTLDHHLRRAGEGWGRAGWRPWVGTRRRASPPRACVHGRVLATAAQPISHSEASALPLSPPPTHRRTPHPTHLLRGQVNVDRLHALNLGRHAPHRAHAALRHSGGTAASACAPLMNAALRSCRPAVGCTSGAHRRRRPVPQQRTSHIMSTFSATSDIAAACCCRAAWLPVCRVGEQGCGETGKGRLGAGGGRRQWRRGGVCAAT